MYNSCIASKAGYDPAVRTNYWFIFLNILFSSYSDDVSFLSSYWLRAEEQWKLSGCELSDVELADVTRTLACSDNEIVEMKAPEWGGLEQIGYPGIQARKL